MKKIILLILLLFAVGSTHTFAQNVFKIGGSSLKDTIVGGRHYIKFSGGVMSQDIISQSDSLLIGDIMVKDSVGNFVIRANTIINGSLKFTNTNMTLASVNVDSLVFADSIRFYRPTGSLLGLNNLTVENTKYKSSFDIKLTGTAPDGYFKIKIGSSGSDTASLILDKGNRNLSFYGRKFNVVGTDIYVNGSALDLPNVAHLNVGSTWSATQDFNLLTANGINVSAILLSGLDINTAGTLTNIPYKDAVNRYTKTEQWSKGTNISVPVSITPTDIQLTNDGNTFITTIGSDVIATIDVSTSYSAEGLIINLLITDTGGKLTHEAGATASALKLKGATDFTITNPTLISFVYLSGQWYEISRTEY